MDIPENSNRGMDATEVEVEEDSSGSDIETTDVKSDESFSEVRPKHSALPVDVEHAWLLELGDGNVGYGFSAVEVMLQRDKSEDGSYNLSATDGPKGTGQRDAEREEKKTGDVPLKENLNGEHSEEERKSNPKLVPPRKRKTVETEDWRKERKKNTPTCTNSQSSGLSAAEKEHSVPSLPAAEGNGAEETVKNGARAERMSKEKSIPDTPMLVKDSGSKKSHHLQGSRCVSPHQKAASVISKTTLKQRNMKRNIANQSGYRLRQRAASSSSTLSNTAPPQSERRGLSTPPASPTLPRSPTTPTSAVLPTSPTLPRSPIPPTSPTPPTSSTPQVSSTLPAHDSSEGETLTQDEHPQSDPPSNLGSTRLSASPLPSSSSEPLASPLLSNPTISTTPPQNSEVPPLQKPTVQTTPHHSVGASLHSTPSVSVHSSPAVLVHSAPSGAVNSTPAVSVSSTPTVLVHTTPTVSVNSAPTVSVSSTPTVSVHIFAPQPMAQPMAQPTTQPTPQPTVTISEEKYNELVARVERTEEELKIMRQWMEEFNEVLIKPKSAPPAKSLSEIEDRLEYIELPSGEKVVQISKDYLETVLHFVPDHRQVARRLVNGLFLESERIGTNVRGCKGKQMDPERMQAIKEAVFELCPVDEEQKEAVWKRCVTGINDQNRNIKSKMKRQMAV